ncbi:MAG: hypothetical protein QXH30_02780, partial [Candidatus Bilamarchaeaceae archaeon]
YIEGAVNIPMNEIFSSLDKLPAKDAPIVVNCVSGHRGSFVTMILPSAALPILLFPERKFRTSPCLSTIAFL